eukprot:g16844.t1
MTHVYPLLVAQYGECMRLIEECTKERWREPPRPRRPRRPRPPCRRRRGPRPRSPVRRASPTSSRPRRPPSGPA